ncbi:MAG: SDR family NAD(P)-dependent oxidoreductase, partial [Planctomycetaceae bacterium]
MKILPRKQAMITGVAGGIGRAIALELARRGTALWLVDINEAGLENVRREVQALGAEVVTQLCDLSKMDEIAACVNQVRERWGGLDILINNAG